MQPDARPVRGDLRPGQVFVVPWTPALRVFTDDIFVVIDATTEVGFWRGGEYHIGDVAPSITVEVVS